MPARNSPDCILKCRSGFPKRFLRWTRIPSHPAPKKLKNRDGFRIRIGDYRVLYLADTKLKQIVIGSIAHRREVYRD